MQLVHLCKAGREPLSGWKSCVCLQVHSNFMLLSLPPRANFNIWTWQQGLRLKWAFPASCRLKQAATLKRDGPDRRPHQPKTLEVHVISYHCRSMSWDIGGPNLPFLRQDVAIYKYKLHTCAENKYDTNEQRKATKVQICTTGDNGCKCF